MNQNAVRVSEHGRRATASACICLCTVYSERTLLAAKSVEYLGSLQSASYEVSIFHLFQCEGKNIDPCDMTSLVAHTSWAGVKNMLIQYPAQGNNTQGHVTGTPTWWLCSSHLNG